MAYAAITYGFGEGEISGDGLGDDSDDGDGDSMGDGEGDDSGVGETVGRAVGCLHPSLHNFIAWLQAAAFALPAFRHV